MEIQILSGSVTTRRGRRSFRYDRWKNPLSVFKTLVKVPSPYFLWFQRSSDNKLFVNKGNNFVTSGSFQAKGHSVP